MSGTVNELFSVAGKVAVVTGGSAGIGRMIAGGLVAAGVKTYIVARNAESANKAAQEMSEQGGYCKALIADCSSLDGIKSVAEQLQQQESQLDILVNNAGILFEEPIDEFTEESWDMSFDLNTKSVFFLTQKLLPLLRAGADAEDPSRIINIGSADGSSLSEREHYAYLASKASVHHLTKGLAKRLAREHITVNAIAPGPFPSAMTGGFPEEIVNAVISLIPRGRFGTEQDIIGTVVYLASRAGAYTTASVIPLDGGWTGTK